MQRHKERRDTGRRADRVMAIVWKHYPRMQELRIYVGNLPGKTSELHKAQPKEVFKEAMEETQRQERKKAKKQAKKEAKTSRST